MVIGIISIIGAILGLIGIAFKSASPLLGVGILLFFMGFFVSGFALTSIPTVVWIFIILLGIWWLSKKK